MAYRIDTKSIEQNDIEVNTKSINSTDQGCAVVIGLVAGGACSRSRCLNPNDKATGGSRRAFRRPGRNREEDTLRVGIRRYRIHRRKWRRPRRAIAKAAAEEGLAAPLSQTVAARPAQCSSPRRLAFIQTMTIVTMVTMNEVDAMKADIWTVAEAKAKFSEVVERARCGTPQTITRNRRIAVVVVSAEEWERKVQRKGSLAEFFAVSPLRASDLKVKRVKDNPREPNL
jgi:prevent-host-death family protein